VGGDNTAAEIIKGATDGTINIIKYALKANVKKIVYTSTIAALYHCASISSFLRPLIQLYFVN